MRHLIAAVLLAAGIAGPAAAECRADRLDLRGDWGRAQFTVEVAKSNEEISRGLMHRPSMAASAGMIFVYPAPRSVHFWMRNTLIPLDMVFVGADGVVRRVHENAIPLDETPIWGGDDIQYVLEINGGMARTLGITAGSQMRHPEIAGPGAVWPCADE